MKKIIYMGVMISFLFIINSCQKEGSISPINSSDISTNNESIFQRIGDDNQEIEIASGQNATIMENSTKETLILVENIGSTDLTFCAEKGNCSNQIILEPNEIKIIKMEEIGMIGKGKDKIKVENPGNGMGKLKFRRVINPFEFVGVVHNISLKRIGNHPNFPNLSNQDAFNIIQAVSAEKFKLPAPITLTKVEAIKNSVIINNPGAIDIDFSLINELHSQGEISSKQAQLLNILAAKIETMPNPTALDNTIRGLEHSLSARKDITNLEKRPIYIAYSIAKNSNSFWETASREVSNPWHIIFDENSNQRKICEKKNGDIRWWCVAGADIGGAIGGYFGCDAGGDACVRCAQAAGAFASYFIQL